MSVRDLIKDITDNYSMERLYDLVQESKGIIEKVFFNDI